MVIEALPDWKHKATRFEYECARWGIVLEIDLARTDAEAEFAKWFSNLRDEVQEWKRVAEGVEAPDFDKAVVDLMAMDAKNKEANGDSTSPTMDFEDGDMQEIKKVDSGVHLGE